MKTDNKQIKYIVSNAEEISKLEKELEMLPLEIGHFEGCYDPQSVNEIAVTFDSAGEYDFLVYVDFDGFQRQSPKIAGKYDDLNSAKIWEGTCEGRVAVGPLPDSWRDEVSRRLLEEIVMPSEGEVEVESFEGSNYMDIRYKLEDGKQRRVRFSMLYEGVL